MRNGKYSVCGFPFEDCQDCRYDPASDAWMIPQWEKINELIENLLHLKGFSAKQN